MYIAESNLNMLSPTGRSRMWDAGADGYARGEGVGAVVLKTLSAALRDGDHIECLVRETGINQVSTHPYSFSWGRPHVNTDTRNRTAVPPVSPCLVRLLRVCSSLTRMLGPV